MTSNETNSTSSCTAEFGTKIFAYFNLVLVSVSTLTSLVAFVYFMIAGVFLSLVHTHQVDPVLIIGTIISFVSLFILAKGLIFAILLVCGVRKQKPQYIKAYYVYGIIVVVLSLFSAISILATTSEIGLIICVSIFVVCVLYSFILAMIRKTYRNYETLQNQYQHMPNNEKVLF
ncbi:uncharacterized protein LOC113225614 [Hyposmocoma kahamanoa]|uniref:uncharacterized protein LOC113225614 n=1 Tax=Hyposmocoma kahamanoa TaxID=1477025 RepID=UPI000E6D67F2|nr:uncharacterized protein LOC113225614 [Hyposmocoma kahamanoa]